MEMHNAGGGMSNLNTELREDVSVMCNLSLGIEERAEARGKARGETIGENKKSEKVVINMYKKGYATEQIADIVELSEEEVKNIIEENRFIAETIYKIQSGISILGRSVWKLTDYSIDVFSNYKNRYLILFF